MIFSSMQRTDKRTKEVFRALDVVRLKRTLKRQFCYILGGECASIGREMASVHKDHGVTQRE